MKVIGIDQASHTGFAVIRDGELVKSGTQVFSGDLAKRLSGFLKWFRELVFDELPDFVVFEKPHFRGYAATISGSALIGLIQLVCYETGVACEGVHSATLKKAATGYGRATKKAMTAAANDKEGTKLKVKENNDEADAIHLALNGEKLWKTKSKKSRSK